MWFCSFVTTLEQFQRCDAAVYIRQPVVVQLSVSCTEYAFYSILPIQAFIQLCIDCTKGLVEKVTTFGTYGVSVTLLRLAYRPPLAQRRVLARPRCIRASGYKTRRDTVLQSSAATLAESSAPTAVSREFASQRSSLLQTSGCRGRHMVGNNHAGNTSCSGAARRAADAVAALPRLLQQHAAHAVLES